MIYAILAIVFLCVFGFLAWRIIMNASSASPNVEDAYVCPVCNDQNCVCDKKNNA